MTVRLVRNELHVGSRPLVRPPVRCVAVRADGAVVAVVSTSVSLHGPHGPGRVTDEHLRAEGDEKDPEWLAVADVIVRTDASDRCDPGCALMAVVDGSRERITAPGSGWVIDVPVLDAPGVFASFVHTWLVTGRSAASLARASLLMEDGSCRIRMSRAAGFGRVAS